MADLFPPAGPLLRAPPFPGIAVSLSSGPIVMPTAPSEADIGRLFAAIRAARVGGRFWALPAADAGHILIVRPASKEDVASLHATLNGTERATATWILSAEGALDPATRLLIESGRAILGDVDPWSVLMPGVRIVAHGDDEWAALAHIAGCPVRFLSAGRFGVPGADPADIDARVAGALLGQRYRDPFTGDDTDVDTVIAQLADWRRTLEANRDIVAACGIAWWKRHEIARFLWAPDRRLRFFRSERRAIAHAAKSGGTIAVWPSRVSAGMADAARAKGVSLVRVEDGFVRSVGLGSNLVPPSSVAVDRSGIHYDPGRPSDLEVLLADSRFPSAVLQRAERLRRVILDTGISKYGGDDDYAVPFRQPGRRLVLVPGQVEDDQSVRLGGGGLSSNLELLRRVRALEPDAEIWFRPHPDVDAGHRNGAIRDADALAHADRIVRGGGMARLLGAVDAVHVLTSLTGFEAILRDREVTCHGTPFYAGWGLTRDLAPIPARRGRALTIAQLVAAVLIAYPRYLDPVTGLPCPPEILIRRMADGPSGNRLGWISRLRRLQGKLTRRRFR